jgi:hypothetical protein
MSHVSLFYDRLNSLGFLEPVELLLNKPIPNALFHASEPEVIQLPIYPCVPVSLALVILYDYVRLLICELDSRRLR